MLLKHDGRFTQNETKGISVGCCSFKHNYRVWFLGLQKKLCQLILASTCKMHLDLQ